MVGASSKAKFEDAAIILRAMGKNIVHCGDVGTGQVAKICNNMMLGISMIGVSETMNLGVKFGHLVNNLRSFPKLSSCHRLGIDPKLLAGILNTSSGRCWSSDTYNPCPGVMEGLLEFYIRCSHQHFASPLQGSHQVADILAVSAAR